MKRLFIAITCAIMFVIPTLSGCGSKEQTSEDVKASSDVSKEKTESVEEKESNIDGGSSGSVFATGADWLSKVPKLSEPLGITLGQTYYDDYNMPSVEVIPANDLWEMNDDNGNITIRQNKTNGFYYGIKGNKFVYEMKNFGNSGDSFSETGIDKEPLVITDGEGSDMFVYRAKDCYAIYFVNDVENYKDAHIFAMILTSDSDYNNYLNGTAETKVVDEKERANRLEEKQEYRENLENKKNTILELLQIGTTAYCSENNMSVTVKQCDFNTATLLFDFPDGDEYDGEYEYGVVRHGMSDDGSTGYINLSGITDAESGGGIYIREDSLDLSKFYSPFGYTAEGDGKDYIFYFNGQGFNGQVADNNSDYSVELNGSTLSDYWGSYYDTSNLGLGIEIIGENDEPFVQISESETGKAWQFYCDYENNELGYTDGECFIEGDNRKYIYRNGTGKFYFKDEVLYWEDDIDGKGDGYKFEKLRPQDLLEMQYNNGN